jgi:hypothetical protein
VVIELIDKGAAFNDFCKMRHAVFDLVDRYVIGQVNALGMIRLLLSLTRDIRGLHHRHISFTQYVRAAVGHAYNSVCRNGLLRLVRALEIRTLMLS